MKRLVTLVTLIFIFTTTALAQDDYKKFEFFGGYSALYLDNLAGDTGSPAVDDVLGEKQTLRGFNLAAGYNFHKYVGAKFDYSLHLREDNFTRPLGSGTIDTTLQNFLGGIQVEHHRYDYVDRDQLHSLVPISLSITADQRSDHHRDEQ